MSAPTAHPDSPKPEKVKPGTAILIGAPSHPMPRERSKALAKMVAEFDDVMEAHLPQCYIPGLTQDPQQVLVLVLQTKKLVPELLPQVLTKLKKILPKGERLEILPIDLSSNIFMDVREAECCIYKKSEKIETDKPWWKVW